MLVRVWPFVRRQRKQMTKICAYCGKTFEPGKGRHQAKCCSAECAKARHRKRALDYYYTHERGSSRRRDRKASPEKILLRCAGCGETFFHWTGSKGRSPKFCHKCRANGGKPKKRIDLVRRPKKREPAPKVKKTCPICGKTFEGYQKRVYCGSECAKVANTKRTVESHRKIYTKRKVKKTPKPKSQVDRCVCQRVQTCVYGQRFVSTGMRFCDYITVEGHARGGYPDECKHYRPKGR